jgi:hypothetical protein
MITLSPSACARSIRLIEIGERAEARIDVAVVGDVVAEILHRRSEERRQPDRRDAERGDVLEPRRDAGQIADAVVVGIREAVRIDLVDRRAEPPRAAGGWRDAWGRLRRRAHVPSPAAHTTKSSGASTTR